MLELTNDLEVSDSFTSCLSEERLMQVLDCTRENFMTDTIVQARVRADETMSFLASQCGNTAAFDNLLLKYALGHHSFTTKNRRMEMTAYEQLDAVQDVRDEPEPQILGFAGITPD